MLLIKFGGSSVGSVENLHRVVQIVKNPLRWWYPPSLG